MQTLIDGENFRFFDTYLVGDKGLILNKNHRPIKGDTFRLLGKNYRRANFIASVWMNKPSEKARLHFIDGDKRNCRLSNLTYKQSAITFKEYKRCVIKITKTQPINLLKDIDKRGFNSCHVDHIISIGMGYKCKIPIDLIANINNLQVITKEENKKKGIDSYCNIAQCEHLKTING